MNRIVLIGNGFDLAHGLKTSYADSIYWYWKSRILNSYEVRSNEWDDGLCKLTYLQGLWSDNYRRMMEFIESAPFQVVIMGHSCGNSDRTLLNTIFEHCNCISIKAYFYQKNEQEDNYLEIVQNISRNFTDMKLMRDRVVNKTYCEPLTNMNNN